MHSSSSSVSRRKLLIAAGLFPAMGAMAQSGKVLVEVWKDPSCGCCKDWVAHLQASGFAVKLNDAGNDAMRAKLGIPQKLASCHTALVSGYAIEGHVPAADIRRLLKDKPHAIGLSVPGMPVGAPGMDGAMYGNRRDPYDVMIVLRSGEARVYASYNKA
jgi:hypothetical protein